METEIYKCRCEDECEPRYCAVENTPYSSRYYISTTSGKIVSELDRRPHILDECDCVLLGNYGCELDKTEWSDCIGECGQGTQYRTVTIVNSQVLNGAPCPHSRITKESRNCQLPPCVTDIPTPPPSPSPSPSPTLVRTDCIPTWSDWSTCSAQCDGGTQVRTLISEVPPQNGGTPCEPTQTRHCNTNPCVSDCEVSEWTDWGPCSRPCGGGTKTRTRTIHNRNLNGGIPCPPLTETTSCNTHLCPVDCVVSVWSDWTQCSELCGGGMQRRTRTVITQPKGSGAKCPSLSAAKSCNTDPCEIDCKTTPWSHWTDCTSECGGGTTSRTRSIIIHPRHGGVECGPLTDTIPCNTSECPPNCEYEFAIDSADMPWVSTTSGALDGKLHAKQIMSHRIYNKTTGTRYRIMDIFEAMGYGVIEEEDTFQGQLPTWIGPEPGDRAYPNSTFTFKISKQGREAGLEDIPTTHHTFVETNTDKDPRPGGASTTWETTLNPPDGYLWDLWDSSRVIPLSEEHGAGGTSILKHAELALELLTEMCINGDNPDILDPDPIDCKLTDWSDWSTCSQACKSMSGEVGTQERHRSVEVYPQNGGLECTGETTQHRPCNTSPCPIDCTVTAWTTWGVCSAECGGGEQSRTREVKIKNYFGGKECPPLRQTRVCNVNPCGLFMLGPNGEGIIDTRIGKLYEGPHTRHEFPENRSVVRLLAGLGYGHYIRNFQGIHDTWMQIDLYWKNNPYSESYVSLTHPQGDGVKRICSSSSGACNGPTPEELERGPEWLPLRKQLVNQLNGVFKDNERGYFTDGLMNPWLVKKNWYKGVLSTQPSATDQIFGDGFTTYGCNPIPYQNHFGPNQEPPPLSTRC